MTRFARAKGSKSSNEKKPEEATSWSEMKKSMLSKSTPKPEKFTPEEKVKISEPKQAEWASLGDEFSNSISLMKQHLGKKNKKVDTISSDEMKTKKGKTTENVFESGISKSKQKDGEDKNPEECEGKGKKKNKKRKFTNTDKEVGTSPKKKKKLKDEKLVEKSINENAENIQEKVEFKKIKKFKGKQGSNLESKKTFNGKKQQSKRENNKKKKLENNNSSVEELIINGEKIPIVKFQGFFITHEDAERLKKLRAEMKKEGIPKAKIEVAIKLERRRAEKALSRLKKSVCFHCRERGHLLSHCPNLVEKENTSTGICYKCGSTEHSAVECKVVKGKHFQFAECFICKEQGHIARQCPDNPRGLYPQGGACRECGDVTHLRRDCPNVQAKKSEEVVTVGLRNDRNLECLDEEIANKEKQNVKKKIKKNAVVKF